MRLRLLSFTPLHELFASVGCGGSCNCLMCVPRTLLFFSSQLFVVRLGTRPVYRTFHLVDLLVDVGGLVLRQKWMWVLVRS
jgi:hypothetical protein